MTGSRSRKPEPRRLAAEKVPSLGRNEEMPKAFSRGPGAQMGRMESEGEDEPDRGSQEAVMEIQAGRARSMRNGGGRR